MVNIALGISHTPWVPERVASCNRLLEQLDVQAIDGGYMAPEHVVVRMISDRAPNDVWSERMWRWAAETDAEWCLFLQDDVEVPDNFWPALRALLEALPAEAEVLGLETAHPAAGALCDEDVRLMTTADGLIGVGYAIRREALVAFLEWRRTKLVDGWRTAAGGKPALTEDTMIGLWCLATGRRVWHPIPTIIDHDTSIASTYGNDDHANRRPVVTWKDAARRGHKWLDDDLELPAFWHGAFVRVPIKDGAEVVGHQRAETIEGMIEPPRHLGRFYDATPGMAHRWVVDFDAGKRARAIADSGDREKRRLAYARRARADWRPRARVLICTPTRGGVHPEYTSGMLSTVRLFEVDVDDGFELLDAWQWHEDVVRVRSRFLRAARETECTAVHFRDADLAVPGRVLLGMVAAEKAIVCTPYPRRDGIHWEGVRALARSGQNAPLEAAAYTYNGGAIAGEEPDESGCVRVTWAQLGCSLIQREAFERMIDHYDALDLQRVDLERARDRGRELHSSVVLHAIIDELVDELERWRAGHMGLRFVDEVNKVRHETVGLFQLLVRDGRLNDETMSFCLRAGDLGIPIHMYLGPGSPVSHAGEHLYRGHIEALGYHRMAGPAPRDAARAKTDPAPPPRGPFALDTPEDPAREPQEPAVP